MASSTTVMAVCAIVSCAIPATPLRATAPLEFEPREILEWEAHSFRGETRYRLVEVDGQPAVHAHCSGRSASGLFYRGDIDLAATPILEWRWRIERVFVEIDETTRHGDDYAARLYVVDERRLARWRTRALNYVWASRMPPGADWPNAYATQARMIALRSGAPTTPGWHTERRDLRADFQQHHGRVPERINALAIMTDCDDSGQEAEAWYGPIRLLPADDG